MSEQQNEKGHRFPLGRHHRDEVRTGSGRALSELGLEQVLAGLVGADDVSVRAETLELQAGFARQQGYDEVAANLARAAEMTRIPNDEILKIYEALRPGRSTYYQLLSMSQQLASQYNAVHTGNYIREAADAYRDTGLLRMDEE